MIKGKPNVNRLYSLIRKERKRLLDRAANWCKAEMQRRILGSIHGGFKTGRLLNSVKITSIEAGKARRVGSFIKYAVFQNYGTGLSGPKKRFFIIRARDRRYNFSRRNAANRYKKALSLHLLFEKFVFNLFRKEKAKRKRAQTRVFRRIRTFKKTRTALRFVSKGTVFYRKEVVHPGNPPLRFVQETLEHFLNFYR